MNWEQVKSHRLTVYTTTWCPDCRRCRKQLEAAGVRYREVDIDADPEAAQRLQEKTGRKAIPYVEIDERWFIRGWHDEAPGKWDEEIFLKEFADAIK